MNSGDTPRVPTAEEVSHQRRFRCTYMRSTFTTLEEEVDIPNKVFQADPGAKSFMSSGEAVWCFFQDFLFPHLRASGVQRCSDNLEYMKKGTSMHKDTHWLLRKMNRTTDCINPDTAQGLEAQIGEAPAAALAERIVRETHASIHVQFFSVAFALVHPPKSLSIGRTLILSLNKQAPGIQFFFEPCPRLAVQSFYLLTLI